MPDREQVPTEPVTEVKAPGGAHVVVTLESIYTLVLETASGVSTANSKLDTAASKIDDHETRLRALEKRVYAFAGIIGLLGGGIGSAVLTALRTVAP